MPSLPQSNQQLQQLLVNLGSWDFSVFDAHTASEVGPHPLLLWVCCKGVQVYVWPAAKSLQQLRVHCRELWNCARGVGLRFLFIDTVGRGTPCTGWPCLSWRPTTSLPSCTWT